MQKKFLLLADYNLSSVLPLTFLKKEREIFFLLLSLPVPQPHMPILKWKDMGRLRERKRTLRKRNPQGPKNPVSILLFLMLSAKIIICQQQKCGLQEHVFLPTSSPKSKPAPPPTSQSAHGMVNMTHMSAPPYGRIPRRTGLRRAHRRYQA